MHEAVVRVARKIVLVAPVAVMALFWVAGARGGEAVANGRPAGNVIKRLSENDRSIVGQPGDIEAANGSGTGSKDQGGVQPEVIPRGVPVPSPGSASPASDFTTAAEPTLESIIAKIRQQYQAPMQPEVVPPGIAAVSPGSVSAAGGDQAANGEPWRYQWYAGRWWYWMPDNHWKWWDQRQGWIDYRPPSPSVVPTYASYGTPCSACYGYGPALVGVGPGGVTVNAGPVFVGVSGGHVAVSVFGIGFGF